MARAEPIPAEQFISLSKNLHPKMKLPAVKGS